MKFGCMLGVWWVNVELGGSECYGVAQCYGVGQSGVEWVRVEWSGSEWSGVGQKGVEWVGTHNHVPCS